MRYDLQHSIGMNDVVQANDLCEYLEWDSEAFGKRIGRIKINRLCQEDINEITTWCDLHSIDCLYFLCKADDAETVRVAEDNALRLVDIRVTLERCLSELTIDGLSPCVRLCVPADIPFLKDIARISHRDSRFYYDPNFPRDRCDALYETWITKSCNGYADAVWVAEFARRPVGYLSCHLRDETSGQIGLFAVSPDVQGQGLGRKLLDAALQWFAEHRVANVSVVTQGRNCRAQHFYQKHGFMTRSVYLWYHWWFGR